MQRCTVTLQTASRDSGYFRDDLDAHTDAHGYAVISTGNLFGPRGRRADIYYEGPPETFASLKLDLERVGRRLREAGRITAFAVYAWPMK